MTSTAPIVLVAFVIVLAYFFAKVEIHIEGEHGWAAGLPTWRIESHPLLDIFWGGRPLTGYHAWAFSFMALVFHLPLALFGVLTLQLESRCIGSLMLFWILEDFLWFVLHPSYTAGQLFRGEIPWHKRMLLRLPTDYWVFGIVGSIILAFSYR